MSFVVTYSRNTGRVRNMFYPDSDDQIPTLRFFFGENYVVLPEENKSLDLHAIQVLVCNMTGLYPTNDRYAAVDPDGRVRTVLVCDPAIDAIPECKLIASQEAEVGWTYSVETGFLAPPPVPVAEPLPEFPE